MSEIEDTLKELISQFHKKVGSDEKFKKKIKDLEKKAILEISDENIYHFHLKGAHIVDFGVGDFDEKDLTITTDKDTFLKMQKKEISPFKAFAEKKISFKGSMTDLLLMKSVLVGD